MFKNKPYITCKVGAWNFDFYYKEGNLNKTYLKITAISGIMSLVVSGNTHAYGYLLAAAQQGKIEQLHGYAVTLFIPAMTITQDQGLCFEVQKSITKWQKRKEKAAESAETGISDAQNMADEQLMREAAKRGEMSRKEAKKASKADREEMKRILKEDNDGKQA